MRLFERWADFYFFHSKCILSLCLLISSIAIVQGLIVMRSQIRYTIYKTINKVLYCVVIATMAILLNNIGISFEIKYAYFNVIFFSFTIIAIILYEIIQGIIFKAIKEPVLQGMKNIQYTIFFTIFLFYPIFQKFAICIPIIVRIEQRLNLHVQSASQQLQSPRYPDVPAPVPLWNRK